MTASTTTTTTTTTTATTTPIPIDRHWIQKLILEHSHKNPNEGKALVVAPMVDQSDYPFRLLCRRYGTNLCFTPMIHSKMLIQNMNYRNRFVPKAQHANDRPLIAQLCGHDPELLSQAATMLLPYVDGIDLNCGCPQGIAKRGFYGAFLLEDEEVLLKCVQRLVQISTKPVSVKVRLLPGDPQKTIDLYQKLINSGIHLLTIHGRTRHQLKDHTGGADWEMIKTIVEMFGHQIPIFANGSISSLADAQRCFDYTGVDGVMSSEAILEYPALFHQPQQPRVGRIQLAKEYLQLAKEYPPEQGGQGSGIKCLRAHIHRYLHDDLEGNNVLRQRVAQARDWQVLWDTVLYIEQKQITEGHKIEEEVLAWYVRHRNTTDPTKKALSKAVDGDDLDPAAEDEEDEEAEECRTCLFGDADDDGDY